MCNYDTRLKDVWHNYKIVSASAPIQKCAGSTFSFMKSRKEVGQFCKKTFDLKKALATFTLRTVSYRRRQ